MIITSLHLIHSGCVAALLGLITSAGNAQTAPDTAGQPVNAHLTILPGGDPGTPLAQKLPYAINDQGTVVGYSQRDNFVYSGAPAELTAFTGAALWSGKGFDFSILPDPPEAQAERFLFGSASGINNKGVVVGVVTDYSKLALGSISSRAVRWDNGVPTDLGAVSGYSRSSARTINNAGEIAGSIGDWPMLQAVRWTPSGQLQPLNLLLTHNASFASGINSAGRIVGYSGFEDGDLTTERRPVYWNGASVIELATPAGFNQGQASAINATGTIVGHSAAFDLDIYDYTAVRATIWTQGVPSFLPLLPGFSASSASSINARGMAIGACYPEAYEAIYGFGGVPVLWDNGEVIDLRPLLEPFFPEGSEFSVTDINAAGQIIGSAYGQGFVLTVRAAAHRR